MEEGERIFVPSQVLRFEPLLDIDVGIGISLNKHVRKDEDENTTTQDAMRFLDDTLEKHGVCGVFLKDSLVATYDFAQDDLGLWQEADNKFRFTPEMVWKTIISGKSAEREQFLVRSVYQPAIRTVLKSILLLSFADGIDWRKGGVKYLIENVTMPHISIARTDETREQFVDRVTMGVRDQELHDGFIGACFHPNNAPTSMEEVAECMNKTNDLLMVRNLHLSFIHMGDVKEDYHIISRGLSFNLAHQLGMCFCKEIMGEKECIVYSNESLFDELRKEMRKEKRLS